MCGGAQGDVGLNLIAANTGSKRFHNKRVAHTHDQLDRHTLLLPPRVVLKLQKRRQSFLMLVQGSFEAAVACALTSGCEEEET